MTSLPFKQVDVFTAVPFRGNPVAVVFEADGLAEETMQQIANWTNLSETTFIQSSARADYRLRIFTPRSELPFAGHPTVGSAHAIREAGVIPSRQTAMVQDCRAGLIPIIIEADNSVLARVPTPRILSELSENDDLPSILGEAACTTGLVIDVGPIWMVVAVKTVECLYNLTIDAQQLIKLSHKTGSVGICLYAVDDSGEVHVRSFAPAIGVFEDPVCGSGNAAVAAHLKKANPKRIAGSSYIARQGLALGRDGYICVRMEGDEVLIGGRSVTTVDGTIKL